ncbi:MAG TPA: mannose-6-phosphate isomerase [Phycisphaerales bacterium]|nr:mannose-6-phosphate isomerase [Phycisphaerales bacterium]
MPSATEPYPLEFEPILLPKVWGGRRLSALGKALPEGENIGESWEIADLASTDPTGAGGQAKRSVIANGPLSGKTLHAAMNAWGPALLGPAKAATDGGFPLLVKFLDAREHLSVQVHPSPVYAKDHPQANLKSECWYVLSAETGERGEQPVVFKGFKPGVTEQDYREAIGQGRVPELLNAVPAVVGEMHDLPSGTIHALGAGVLVAEVQTPSDTTFRVFDWIAKYNRPVRGLHIEQALESTLFEDPPPATSGEGVLVQNEYFSVRQILAHCEEKPIAEPGRCTAMMMLETMGATLASRSEKFGEITMEPGKTVLVPAACVEDVVLRGGPGTKALAVEITS